MSSDNSTENHQLNTKKGTTRKKLSDEEKKTRQREHARAWYLKKKAAEGKGPKGKNKNKRTPGKKESKTFLFFTIGKDEFTELIPEKQAEARAMQIFTDPDYQKLQHIYFMKPLKLYSRPKLVVTNL